MKWLYCAIQKHNGITTHVTFWKGTEISYPHWPGDTNFAPWMVPQYVLAYKKQMERVTFILDAKRGYLDEMEGKLLPTAH